jgi:hypothetical protein
MPRPDAPLSVEIPQAGSDRPAWGKVGIVAAAGFVVGILWPRFTNTRIAPNPPADNGAAAVAIAPAVSSSAAPPSTSNAPLAAPPLAAPATEQAIMVGPGAILRCRDGNFDSEVDCGSLEFDPIAVPRIKALAQCPAAGSATGKLSIGFDVDFRKRAVRVLLGKSTTMAREKAEALVKCADTAFDRVSLAAVPHEHRRYTVFYTASFAAQARSGEPTNDAAKSPTHLGSPQGGTVDEKPAIEGPAAGRTTSESPASGISTVNWDVAIVRDAPKIGTIVGRVLRGSKVKVLAHQGEWYRVQYGSIQGWVYRGTIGL